MRYFKVSVLAALAVAGFSQSPNAGQAVTLPTNTTVGANGPSDGVVSGCAKADWSSLNALVGKYPADTHLFDTSVIASDLKMLLGEKLSTLKSNVETSAPDPFCICRATRPIRVAETPLIF